MKDSKKGSNSKSAPQKEDLILLLETVVLPLTNALNPLTLKEVTQPTNFPDPTHPFSIDLSPPPQETSQLFVSIESNSS